MEKAIALFKEAAGRALARLREQLAAIRTDRAAPALVEQRTVEYLGSPLTIQQLASIATPDSRTIVITPWDRQSIEAIAKALEKADLGAMPVVSGEEILVTLPPLSQERRELLAKEVRKQGEEARVALRRRRDEALSTLRDAKQEKAISEDVFFKQKQELEKAMEKAQEEIEELLTRKEKEILGTA